MQTTVIEDGSVWIDPAGCDSTVSYKVVREEYEQSKPQIAGTVQLADCSHKITWQFYGNLSEADNIAKIDRAIATLQAFKKAMKAAYRNLK